MHLLQSFYRANKDIYLLWCSVFLRLCGYALVNQILALHLELLGASPTQIGIFMTFTLIGDTVVSYILTWNAEFLGRRMVLCLGAAMMFITGLVFSTSNSFWVLLFVTTVGVISPSGDEAGPFKSVEEACIAHLTLNHDRPEIYAFYALFTTFGSAFGSLIAGYLIDYLNLLHGWDLLTCYRSAYVVYTIFAAVKFVLMLCLSSECELQPNEEEDELLVPKGTLSSTTKRYLPRLLVVFMLDSLGYGFMPGGWIVYYVKKTFGVSATALGTLFFANNVVNAVSLIPSAILARGLGPVRAIIATQVPSALFVGAIPALSGFPAVAIAIFLYYATGSMDVIPRQLLMTSIIPGQELTKVMGVINTGKIFARCIGPVFTGRLASLGKLYYAFVINMVCVLMADGFLALNFLHLDAEMVH